MINKPFLQIGSFHAAFLGENTVRFLGSRIPLPPHLFYLQNPYFPFFWSVLWRYSVSFLLSKKDTNIPGFFLQGHFQHPSSALQRPFAATRTPPELIIFKWKVGKGWKYSEDFGSSYRRRREGADICPVLLFNY